MTVGFSTSLMLLVVLCGILLGRAGTLVVRFRPLVLSLSDLTIIVNPTDSTLSVGYETHNLATGVPGSGVSSTGVDVALLGLRLPGRSSDYDEHLDSLLSTASLQCGRNIIEVLPKKTRAPNAAPFLIPLPKGSLSSSNSQYNTWLVLSSLNGRLPRISSCSFSIGSSDAVPLSPSPLINNAAIPSITQAIADVFLHTLNPAASQTVASLLTPPSTSFLETGTQLSAEAEAQATAAATARLEQLLDTMQTLQTTHGTRAGHRIIWQLTLRGLALSVREFVLLHLQEAYYLHIKSKALPFLTELICTGKVDPIAMPSPIVDAPEPLLDPKVDEEQPVPPEGFYPAPPAEEVAAGAEEAPAEFLEVDTQTKVGAGAGVASRDDGGAAAAPGGEGGAGGGEGEGKDAGDDSTAALKPKPSILFDLVSWVAAPVTSAVEPAISLAISDALQNAVAMNVDDKLKRVVNATVAKRVGMATVTLLSERLTHGLARAITHGVVRKSIPGVVQELGSATMASLSHSLTMTLTRSLARDPKIDEACKECGENMKDYQLQPAGVRKPCNECKVGTWNDYYLDYYTTYYTQYYYGYYGFYYNSYFSRVFAEEQLARLEQDVAKASAEGEAAIAAGAAEAQAAGPPQQQEGGE